MLDAVMLLCVGEIVVGALVFVIIVGELIGYIVVDVLVDGAFVDLCVGASLVGVADVGVFVGAFVGLDKIINKIIEKEYYINSKNYLDTDLYDKALKKYCNSFNCVKTCDICFNEKNEYFNRFCCNNNIICVSCSVEHIVKSEKNGSCPFCNDTNFRKDFNYIQNRLIKNLLKT